MTKSQLKVFDHRQLHSKVMKDRIMDNNLRKFGPKGNEKKQPTLKKSNSQEHLTAAEKITKESIDRNDRKDVTEKE